MRPATSSSARCSATHAFEGTRGQGRVYSGRLGGRLHPDSRARARCATRCCRPARCRSKASRSAPRCAACRSSPASISNTPTTTASAVRSRAWALPIANSPAMAAGARTCVQRASTSASAGAAAVAHRRHAIASGLTPYRRKNHARRRGVRVKLAGAILEVAFRRRHRTPAMNDAAFRAHRPGVLGHRRTKLSFSSSVVQVSPLCSVEKIAQPSAESSSVAANPPCTVPIGL